MRGSVPPPIDVDLVPHDPLWAAMAAEESLNLEAAMGGNLPVVGRLDLLDRRQQAVEVLGYDWRGEYGLPGRRYCFKDDPKTGRRLFQLHCYEEGTPEVRSHLAFRAHLRGNPMMP